MKNFLRFIIFLCVAVGCKNSNADAPESSHHKTSSNDETDTNKDSNDENESDSGWSASQVKKAKKSLVYFFEQGDVNHQHNSVSTLNESASCVISQLQEQIDYTDFAAVMAHYTIDPDGQLSDRLKKVQHAMEKQFDNCGKKNGLEK